MLPDQILSYVCTCYASYFTYYILYKLIRFAKSCLQTCRSGDYPIITHYTNLLKIVLHLTNKVLHKNNTVAVSMSALCTIL